MPTLGLVAGYTSAGSGSETERCLSYESFHCVGEASQCPKSPQEGQRILA